MILCDCGTVHDLKDPNGPIAGLDSMLDTLRKERDEARAEVECARRTIRIMAEAAHTLAASYPASKMLRHGDVTSGAIVDTLRSQVVNKRRMHEKLMDLFELGAKALDHHRDREGGL